MTTKVGLNDIETLRYAIESELKALQITGQNNLEKIQKAEKLCNRLTDDALKRIAISEKKMESCVSQLETLEEKNYVQTRYEENRKYQLNSLEKDITYKMETEIAKLLELVKKSAGGDYYRGSLLPQEVCSLPPDISKSTIIREAPVTANYSNYTPRSPPRLLTHEKSPNSTFGVNRTKSDSFIDTSPNDTLLLQEVPRISIHYIYIYIYREY